MINDKNVKDTVLWKRWLVLIKYALPHATRGVRYSDVVWSDPIMHHRKTRVTRYFKKGIKKDNFPHFHYIRVFRARITSTFINTSYSLRFCQHFSQQYIGRTILQQCRQVRFRWNIPTALPDNLVNQIS